MSAKYRVFLMAIVTIALFSGCQRTVSGTVTFDDVRLDCGARSDIDCAFSEELANFIAVIPYFRRDAENPTLVGGWKVNLEEGICQGDPRQPPPYEYHKIEGNITRFFWDLFDTRRELWYNPDWYDLYEMTLPEIADVLNAFNYCLNPPYGECCVNECIGMCRYLDDYGVNAYDFAQWYNYLYYHRQYYDIQPIIEHNCLENSNPVVGQCTP